MFGRLQCHIPLETNVYLSPPGFLKAHTASSYKRIKKQRNTAKGKMKENKPKFS